MSYRLETHEYEALRAGAFAIGETCAFLTVVEGSSGLAAEDRDYWLIGLDHYPYPALEELGFVPIMETAMYSTAGTWGLIISHEQHALLGGSATFFEGFKQTISDFQSPLRAFLQAWKRNHDQLGSQVHWLYPLLTHLLGEEEARRELWHGSFRFLLAQVDEEHRLRSLPAAGEPPNL